MAIEADVLTEYGEERSCYIRLNNVEVSNHGEVAKALFRGFASKQAFEEGARYMLEHGVEFKADVGQPLWAQAYAALRQSIPHVDIKPLPDNGEAPAEAVKEHDKKVAQNERFAAAMMAAKNC